MSEAESWRKEGRRLFDLLSVSPMPNADSYGSVDGILDWLKIIAASETEYSDHARAYIDLASSNPKQIASICEEMRLIVELGK